MSASLRVFARPYAATLLIAAAIGASAPTRSSDCARDELVGPVHTVVTTRQILQNGADGKPDTSQLLVAEETYDRTCALVESKQYKGDFLDDQHFERVDATTVIVHSNMGDRTVQDRYDEAGRRVESRTTRGDGQFEDRSLYVYDRSGRVVRIDWLDAAGKPYDFTTFTRDADGHVVRQLIHFGDGRMQIQTSRYEFDAHGNWIKEYNSSNDPDHDIKTIRPTDILFRAITYY
jgi:hypothetical protein